MSKKLGRAFYISAGFAAGLGASVAITPHVNNHPLGAAFTQSMEGPVSSLMDGIAKVSGYDEYTKYHNAGDGGADCPTLFDEKGIPVPCME